MRGRVIIFSTGFGEKRWGEGRVSLQSGDVDVLEVEGVDAEVAGCQERFVAREFDVSYPTQGALKVSTAGFACVLGVDDEDAITLKVEEQALVVCAHDAEVGSFGVAHEPLTEGRGRHVVDMDVSGSLVVAQLVLVEVVPVSIGGQVQTVSIRQQVAHIPSQEASEVTQDSFLSVVALVEQVETEEALVTSAPAAGLVLVTFLDATGVAAQEANLGAHAEGFDQLTGNVDVVAFGPFTILQTPLLCEVTVTIVGVVVLLVATGRFAQGYIEVVCIERDQTGEVHGPLVAALVVVVLCQHFGGVAGFVRVADVYEQELRGVGTGVVIIVCEVVYNTCLGFDELGA